MTRKIVRRLIIFVVIVALLIAYLSMVFTFPRDQKSDMVRERFNSYYALPKDTVDGFFIGTSGVDRYWIPQLAFKEEGVTCYGFTSGNQPIVYVKYIMAEAMKRHHVKTFIVDLRAITKRPETINDTDVRRVSDNLRFSKNKFEATKAILDFLSKGKTKISTDDLSYYFKLAKYHAGWKDLSKEDFTNPYPKCDYMGYFAYNTNAFKPRSQKVTTVTEKTAKLNKRNRAALEDLLDYCDTLDVNVIFVSSPQSPDIRTQEKINAAFKIVKKRGYTAINFNSYEMYDKLGWDFHKDLYNHGHATFYGAVKYTRWIAKYLKKNCGFEDRRKDDDQSKYQDWYDSYEKTMKRLKKFDKAYYKEIYIKQ